MITSRITTPVVKVIDEWYFEIDGHTVVMDVTLHRPRDPQKVKGEVPKFSFVASLNTRKTLIEGKKVPDYNEYFPTSRFEAESIAELRDKVEAGLWEQVAFKWDDVIVLKISKSLTLGESHERTPNGVKIHLDFDRCQCSKNKYWRKSEGEWISGSPDHMLDCLSGTGEIHTVPYNDELWESLQEIRSRMIGLVDRLAVLLEPKQHHVLAAMMLSGNLLPPASGK